MATLAGIMRYVKGSPTRAARLYQAQGYPGDEREIREIFKLRSGKTVAAQQRRRAKYEAWSGQIDLRTRPRIPGPGEQPRSASSGGIPRSHAPVVGRRAYVEVGRWDQLDANGRVLKYNYRQVTMTQWQRLYAQAAEQLDNSKPWNILVYGDFLNEEGLGDYPPAMDEENQPEDDWSRWFYEGRTTAAELKDIAERIKNENEMIVEGPAVLRLPPGEQERERRRILRGDASQPESYPTPVCRAVSAILGRQFRRVHYIAILQAKD